ncbi:LysR substrate-binding domain-containing protein [Shewanella amazonensis]|uniref:Transcriptional regulator, LysR family n=1 Tax=Shewanella amazonensis (strain ATCC BAA-1098 / SB2B) TaxID=326297 RepID=A1S6T1_SHEAM|nr:LysR substrate-binding domain-containing protein [Shewanella amazonensis]ABM00088.1 transcriptional regulator, LysR family [Shewanella amazonensis SB2B]
MKMTLRQLEVFEAIARSGQVSKAAQWLGMTGPAASMALAELEKQLSVRLFERVGNRLRLNAQGAQLLPLATELLAQASKVEALFNASGAVLAGELKVGASTTIGNFLLAKAAVAFGQQHLDALVDVSIHNTSAVIEQVANFEVELGFIEGHCVDRRLDVRAWHQDHLCVFCHPAHPLAGRKVSVDEVRQQYWVLREEGSGTREHFVNAAHALGLHPEARFCFSTADAIKLAVKQGAGLGVLSELALERELARRELALIEVTGLSITRPFFLIRHKSRQSTALANAFVQFCQNFFNIQERPVV